MDTSKTRRGSRQAARRRILQLATETFGSRLKASVWLTAPNPSLESKRPAELMRSQKGVREVEMALWRGRDCMPA